MSIADAASGGGARGADSAGSREASEGRDPLASGSPSSQPPETLPSNDVQVDDNPAKSSRWGGSVTPRQALAASAVVSRVGHEGALGSVPSPQTGPGPSVKLDEWARCYPIAQLEGYLGEGAPPQPTHKRCRSGLLSLLRFLTTRTSTSVVYPGASGAEASGCGHGGDGGQVGAGSEGEVDGGCMGGGYGHGSGEPGGAAGAGERAAASTIAVVCPQPGQTCFGDHDGAAPWHFEEAPAGIEEGGGCEWTRTQAQATSADLARHPGPVPLGGTRSSCESCGGDAAVHTPGESLEWSTQHVSAAPLVPPGDRTPINLRHVPIAAEPSVLTRVRTNAEKALDVLTDLLTGPGVTRRCGEGIVGPQAELPERHAACRERLRQRLAMRHTDMTPDMHCCSFSIATIRGILQQPQQGTGKATPPCRLWQHAPF
jgi:hypothetical protein